MREANGALIGQLRAREDGGALWFGTPASVGTLTLVPVFHEMDAVDYITYAEASAKGLVEVSEISDSGSVPTLKVTNLATTPVLFVEGEILAGLKQNRALNVTVLVAASATSHLPVACVEAGRWHASGVMRRDDHHLSPQVRATRNRSVAHAVRGYGAFEADQGAVWDGVAERLEAHGVSSVSLAYSDIGARHGKQIDADVSAVRPLPGQRGVVVAVGGEPVCLELFDKASTLQQLWDGMVGSYVADAMVTEIPVAPLEGDRVQRWLRTLGEAEMSEHKGAGLGETIEATGDELVMSALVVDNAVVHAAVFA